MKAQRRKFFSRKQTSDFDSQSLVDDYMRELHLKEQAELSKNFAGMLARSNLLYPRLASSSSQFSSRPEPDVDVMDHPDVNLEPNQMKYSRSLNNYGYAPCPPPPPPRSSRINRVPKVKPDFKGYKQEGQDSILHSEDDYETDSVLSNTQTLFSASDCESIANSQPVRARRFVGVKPRIAAKTAVEPEREAVISQICEKKYFKDNQLRRLNEFVFSEDYKKCLAASIAFDEYERLNCGDNN